MKLLHIDSSILGQDSASRTLTGGIIRQLRAGGPQMHVTYRDLAQEELPHLSAQALRGDDPAAASRDAQVLGEFLAADLPLHRQWTGGTCGGQAGHHRPLARGHAGARVGGVR